MKLINSGWTIIIVFVLFGLVALSFGYFHEYAPYQKQAEYVEQYDQQLVTEGGKLEQTKQKVKKAVKIVTDKTNAWNVYVATHTPPPSLRAGGIDISENPYDLFKDTYTFRDNVQTIVNNQLKKGGVQIVNSGPTIEYPTDPNNVGGLLASYYHFPGFPFPVVLYNLGTIQVRGTYDQILANVRAWKAIPHLLAVTDGLRIDGTSPHLTGTYQLTVVGFIRGTKTFGTIPEAAAATTAFGGGRGRGGPGGPPGGFPGGFPGGPGGPPGMPPGGGRPAMASAPGGSK